MSGLLVMFPGQGVQYPGMGKDFYTNYLAVRELFKKASEIAGVDMAKLCFESDAETLAKTVNAQPSIFLTSIAAYRVYEEKGFRPPICAVGQSLGEISALCAMGAMSFEEGFRFALERGKIMQQAAEENNGAMLAVFGITKEMLEPVVERCAEESAPLCISNYNSKSQFVISGHIESIARAKNALITMGKKVVLLKVNAAFHSPLLSSSKNKLEEVIQTYCINEPDIPVLSNVTGKPHTKIEDIRKLLCEHIVMPVLLDSCLNYAVDHGADVLVDIGPGISMKNTTRISFPSVCSYGLEQDWSYLISDAKLYSGKDLSKENSLGIMDFLKKCQAIAVTTRNSNWDNEEYNAGVIQPYRELQAMHAQYDDNGSEMDVDIKKKALQLLCTILDTKRIPEEEQKELIVSLR